MYNKDLSEDFRLRLSRKDMDFLRALSDDRNCSVSEVVRSVIGEYRRALDSTEVLREALAIARQGKVEGGLSSGDIKTDEHN